LWSHEVSNAYDAPLLAFALGSGVIVVPGAYTNTEYRSIYTLAPHHLASGTVTGAMGSFYGGTKAEAGYSGRLDLGTRFAVEPRVSYNRVDLPAASFTTWLTGGRVGLTLTPRLAVTSLIQHNSTARSVSANLRFRWEYG